MVTYTAPSRTHDAGVPAQWSDDFAVTLEGMIVGETPAQFLEDEIVAYSQTLVARTVVGFNEAREIVTATQTAVPAVAATNALTFAGVGIAAETITIGAVTYTLRAAVTTVANEVLIGATAADTANNLIAAINRGAGAGTTYGSLTLVHPTVSARSTASGVVGLVAKAPGVGGNAIATTETGTNISFATATMAGGLAQVGARPMGILMYPVTTGPTGNKPVGRVLRAGCVNPDLLVWDSSFGTDALKLAAFEGASAPTQFVLRKLSHGTPTAP
jgi:hypothetical protein